MKEKDLHNIKSGFKVPDNYFQDFEHRFMDRIAELDNEHSLPGNNPFKVPDNYFAQFEDRFNERLKSEPKEVKVIPLFRRKAFSYVASVAAVLLVIITSVVLNPESDVTFKDLDVVAVENYLLETLDMSNPEDALLLSDQDAFLATSIGNTIDNDAVLEYLNENVDEPAILLNEE